MKDIHFEVLSCLGKKVRTNKNHWELITKIKHPEMEGKEEAVKEGLRNPIEVRKSADDPDVFLYYTEYGKYFLSIVVRHLNGTGFIITAYITDKIKEGKTAWKK